MQIQGLRLNVYWLVGLVPMSNEKSLANPILDQLCEALRLGYDRGYRKRDAPAWTQFAQPFDCDALFRRDSVFNEVCFSAAQNLVRATSPILYLDSSNEVSAPLAGSCVGAGPIDFGWAAYFTVRKLTGEYV